MSVRGVLIRFDSTESLDEHTADLVSTPKSPNFLRADYFDGAAHGNSGGQLNRRSECSCARIRC